MGFRERPEYQDWRDAVFKLYGRKCIRCGYAGNIHAHHVRPVEDYPELAFDRTNGVPLCGNCHVAIKGDELAHVGELKRLQRDASGGEPAASAEGTSGGATLRERAYADPSNADAVSGWFNATADSTSVVDFWEVNREELNKSYQLPVSILPHLAALGRWQDVITEAERGSRLLSDNAAGVECKVGSIPTLPEEVRAAGNEQIVLLEVQAAKLAGARASLNVQLASFKGAALRSSDGTPRPFRSSGRRPRVCLRPPTSTCACLNRCTKCSSRRMAVIARRGIAPRSQGA